MGHYLINFSIYTAAMLGVICIALFTFKTLSNGGFSKKSSTLDVVDTMKLSARKTLYVVKAGEEKFLIAADIDKTSLISRLDTQTNPIKKSTVTEVVTEARQDNSVKLKSFDGIESMSEFAAVMDSSVIDFGEKRAKKAPMMKELARKLRSEA